MRTHLVWQSRMTPLRSISQYNLSGKITHKILPTSYRIFPGWGRPCYKIALSFDDGPDREFTPEILDVLKQKKAPATFFVIGSSANDDLGLIRREYAEGHQQIGNHTWHAPALE